LLCQQRSLSIDNLFVFLFTLTSFAVPRIAQQKVLLLGIVLALAARTGFIGAAEITIFDCAFYLFGIVLPIVATVEDGRRVMTPMLLVMIAIGGSNDSDNRTRRTTHIGPTRRRGYDR
jgi:tellurite resistance protein TerC